MPKLLTLIASATFVGTLAAPQLASAAEWWLVATTNDSSHFSDRSSMTTVRVAGKNVVRIWNAYFNSTTVDGIRSVKVQNYYDCADRSSAQKSYIQYRPDGTSARSYTEGDYTLRWAPMAPGTIGEANLEFACNAQNVGADQESLSVADNFFLKAGDLETAAELFTPKPPSPRATAPPAGPARKTVPKR